jgi:hypothetical protein
MQNEITITINGKQMTFEEAKDLYNKLDKIFGDKYTPDFIKRERDISPLKPYCKL